MIISYYIVLYYIILYYIISYYIVLYQLYHIGIKYIILSYNFERDYFICCFSCCVHTLLASILQLVPILFLVGFNVICIY